MKLLPALLLNLVVAGGAVLVYDQVRSPDAPTASGLEDGAETSDLEARLAALESSKPVALRTDGASESMLRRIEALESRLAELGRAPTSSEPAADNEAPERRQPVASGDPSEDELERFRRLQKAARQQDRRDKQVQRIDNLLAKAGVRLSAKQRDRVIAAQEAFSPRFSAIWTEAKSNAGDGRDVDWTTLIRETNQTIQREFSTQLGAFLPQADADAVSAALYPDRGK